MADAIELRGLLIQRDLATSLLHSRFHFRDRGRIEQNLKPTAGHVLVATQAVEVSLDLDFDACFTELAPVESIAQRFGRCNRRGLASSPASASVFLAFPDARNPHLPYGKEHLEAVLNALRTYAAKGPRELGDRDASELLENSYPQLLKAALSSQIREKTNRLTAAFLDDWKPFGLSSQDERRVLEQQWEQLFDGSEVLPECLIPQAAAESSKLGAARYLVPLSGHQFQRFRNEITLHEELGCYIIQRPYGDSGLLLSK